MAYKVEEIANKLLAKASNSDFDSLMSNMKLQKMLYYVQGFHLAYFNEALFDEEIEAWMYGPVVPSIYEKYKKYNKSGIPYEGKVIELTSKEEDLFNEVYRVYGEFSAIGLMNMTHREDPWQSTNIGSGNVIDKDKMKKFFKKNLK